MSRSDPLHPKPFVNNPGVDWDAPSGGGGPGFFRKGRPPLPLGMLANRDAGLPVDASPKMPVNAPLPAAPRTGPSDESTVNGTTPTLIFDPEKSTKVGTCKRIVHVQVVRILIDGKVIRPDQYQPLGWLFKKTLATPNGWYVDVGLGVQTSPDYQQNDKAFGTPGKKLRKKEGGIVKAEMSDKVETDGPSRNSQWKGFYDPKDNQAGCKQVVFQYETFSWCMDGGDCGKFYDGGVKWNFTKTWEDQRDGKLGTTKIEDKQLSAPSDDFMSAFNQFNRVREFVPCEKVTK